jgi:tRNA (uracil-5-)-methyltransferase
LPPSQGDTASYAIFDPATKKPVLIDQYPLASKKINLMMKGLSEALKEDEMVRKKLFQVRGISLNPKP